MIDLVKFWEFYALFMLFGIIVAALTTYLVSYACLCATATRQALEKVFGWLWSRRITQLSPVYGRPDPYRVLGPEARENCRGMR